jgi:hypothetical protein
MTMLSTQIVPHDAIKVLDAYDKSEHGWHLVSVHSPVSNIHAFQIVQDCAEEPVTIRLYSDGRWEMHTEIAIDGGEKCSTR